MPPSLTRLALIGLAAFLSAPVHAQLLTHRDLSLAAANTIAETAIESCEAHGYHVSAVVVDRAGETGGLRRRENVGQRERVEGAVVEDHDLDVLRREPGGLQDRPRIVAQQFLDLGVANDAGHILGVRDADRVVVDNAMSCYMALGAVQFARH